jgi:hypothetical protein
VRAVSGWGDFEKVHSLDGVFIANALEASAASGIQTWMSFDMGGEWRVRVERVVCAWREVTPYPHAHSD